VLWDNPGEGGEEGGKGGSEVRRTPIYLWLIHVDVWQTITIL